MYLNYLIEVWRESEETGKHEIHGTFTPEQLIINSIDFEHKESEFYQGCSIKCDEDTILKIGDILYFRFSENCVLRFMISGESKEVSMNGGRHVKFRAMPVSYVKLKNAPRTIETDYTSNHSIIVDKEIVYSELVSATTEGKNYFGVYTSTHNLLMTFYEPFRQSYAINRVHSDNELYDVDFACLEFPYLAVIADNVIQYRYYIINTVAKSEFDKLFQIDITNPVTMEGTVKNLMTELVTTHYTEKKTDIEIPVRYFYKTQGNLENMINSGFPIDNTFTRWLKNDGTEIIIDQPDNKYPNAITSGLYSITEKPLVLDITQPEPIINLSGNSDYLQDLFDVYTNDKYSISGAETREVILREVCRNYHKPTEEQIEEIEYTYISGMLFKTAGDIPYGRDYLFFRNKLENVEHIVGTSTHNHINVISSNSIYKVDKKIRGVRVYGRSSGGRLVYGDAMVDENSVIYSKHGEIIVINDDDVNTMEACKTRAQKELKLLERGQGTIIMNFEDWVNMVETDGNYETLLMCGQVIRVCDDIGAFGTPNAEYNFLVKDISISLTPAEAVVTMSVGRNENFMTSFLTADGSHTDSSGLTQHINCNVFEYDDGQFNATTHVVEEQQEGTIYEYLPAVSPSDLIPGFNSLVSVNETTNNPEYFYIQPNVYNLGQLISYDLPSKDTDLYFSFDANTLRRGESFYMFYKQFGGEYPRPLYDVAYPVKNALLALHFKMDYSFISVKLIDEYNAIHLNGDLSSYFEAGDIITITGSPNPENNGDFTVSAVEYLEPGITFIDIVETLIAETEIQAVNTKIIYALKRLSVKAFNIFAGETDDSESFNIDYGHDNIINVFISQNMPFKVDVSVINSDVVLEKPSDGISGNTTNIDIELTDYLPTNGSKIINPTYKFFNDLETSELYNVQSMYIKSVSGLFNSRECGFLFEPYMLNTLMGITSEGNVELSDTDETEPNVQKNGDDYYLSVPKSSEAMSYSVRLTEENCTVVPHEPFAVRMLTALEIRQLIGFDKENKSVINYVRPNGYEMEVIDNKIFVNIPSGVDISNGFVLENVLREDDETSPDITPDDEYPITLDNLDNVFVMNSNVNYPAISISNDNFNLFDLIVSTPTAFNSPINILEQYQATASHIYRRNINSMWNSIYLVNNSYDDLYDYNIPLTVSDFFIERYVATITEKNVPKSPFKYNAIVSTPIRTDNNPGAPENYHNLKYELYVALKDGTQQRIDRQAIIGYQTQTEYDAEKRFIRLSGIISPEIHYNQNNNYIFFIKITPCDDSGASIHLESSEYTYEEETYRMDLKTIIYTNYISEMTEVESSLRVLSDEEKSLMDEYLETDVPKRGKRGAIMFKKLKRINELKRILEDKQLLGNKRSIEFSDGLEILSGKFINTYNVFNIKEDSMSGGRIANFTHKPWRLKTMNSNYKTNNVVELDSFTDQHGGLVKTEYKNFPSNIYETHTKIYNTSYLMYSGNDELKRLRLLTSDKYTETDVFEYQLFNSSYMLKTRHGKIANAEMGNYCFINDLSSYPIPDLIDDTSKQYLTVGSSRKLNNLKIDYTSVITKIKYRLSSDILITTPDNTDVIFEVNQS